MDTIVDITVKLPVWQLFILLAFLFAIFSVIMNKIIKNRKQIAELKAEVKCKEWDLVVADQYLDESTAKVRRQKAIISRLHKLYHTQHGIIKELKSRQALMVKLSMTWYKEDPNLDIRILESKVREQLAITLQEDGIITYTIKEFSRPGKKFPEIKVTGIIHTAKIEPLKIGEDE